MPGGATTVCVQRDLSLAPVSETLDSTPHTTLYTGKHDGGDLPNPKENKYSHVLEAIKQAKVESDAFIKECGYKLDPDVSRAGASSDSADSMADEENREAADSSSRMPTTAATGSKAGAAPGVETEHTGSSPAGKKPRLD